MSFHKDDVLINRLKKSQLTQKVSTMSGMFRSSLQKGTCCSCSCLKRAFRVCSKQDGQSSTKYIP